MLALDPPALPGCAPLLQGNAHVRRRYPACRSQFIVEPSEYQLHLCTFAHRRYRSKWCDLRRHICCRVLCDNVPFICSSTLRDISVSSTPTVTGLPGNPLNRLAAGLNFISLFETAMLQSRRYVCALLESVRLTPKATCGNSTGSLRCDASIIKRCTL